MYCGKELPKLLAFDVVNEIDEPICQDCYDLEADQAKEDLEEMKEI